MSRSQSCNLCNVHLLAEIPTYSGAGFCTSWFLLHHVPFRNVLPMSCHSLAINPLSLMFSFNCLVDLICLCRFEDRWLSRWVYLFNCCAFCCLVCHIIPFDPNMTWNPVELHSVYRYCEIDLVDLVQDLLDDSLSRFLLQFG
jgi:hypothetical protein